VKPDVSVSPQSASKKAGAKSILFIRGRPLFQMDRKNWSIGSRKMSAPILDEEMEQARITQLAGAKEKARLLLGGLLLGGLLRF
jgi:hypothetical protein